MKLTALSLAVAATVVVGGMTLANSANAEPRLVKVTLVTYTQDEDRDHDTCIFVQVDDRNHTHRVAEANNAECAGGKYGYANHERHEFEVPLTADGRGMTRSQVEGNQFRMGIKANGNDKWKFDAWLVMHFDDGSTYYNDKLKQTLEDRGCSNVWYVGKDGSLVSVTHSCDNNREPTWDGWNFSQQRPPV
jgi:hypothetical protein